MTRDVAGLRAEKKPTGPDAKPNGAFDGEPKLSENHPNSNKGNKKQDESDVTNADYDDDDLDSPRNLKISETPAKFKITVPVPPRFTCGERLERRKEFYSKLEEKNRALEKERLEHEARLKEEEESAIKQLRKSMVYKANPLPGFYRQLPPPPSKTDQPTKQQLLGRSKSPNVKKLNGHRICA